MGVASAQSPVVGPLQIVAVENGTGPSIKEPSVAIASSTLAMCAYMDDDGMGYVTRFSIWNGSTWTQLPQKMQGADPSIVYDSSAGQFVVCTFSGAVGMRMDKYDVSTGSFIGAQIIIPDGSMDKPWLVLGSNLGAFHEMYVSYINSSGTGFGGVPNYGRSVDGGTTWVIGPVISGPGGSGFAPQIAAASSASWPAYVAYNHPNGYGFSEGVDLPGGGMQWTPLTSSTGVNLVVTTVSQPLGMISYIPGPSSAKRVPYLVADKSNSNVLYLFYFDNQESTQDVDVFCARIEKNTTDGAWTVTKARVNDDVAGTHDKDQYQPAAVVGDLGRVHAVFYDDRRYDQVDDELTPLFDAYYAYSVNGGVTFTNIPLTRASEEPVVDFRIPGIGGDMPGEYCGIASVGNTVILTLAGTWRNSPSTDKSVILGTVITF
jgi:hypothetical protein